MKACAWRSVLMAFGDIITCAMMLAPRAQLQTFLTFALVNAIIKPTVKTICVLKSVQVQEFMQTLTTTFVQVLAPGICMETQQIINVLKFAQRWGITEILLSTAKMTAIL